MKNKLYILAVMIISYLIICYGMVIFILGLLAASYKVNELMNLNSCELFNEDWWTSVKVYFSIATLIAIATGFLETFFQQPQINFRIDLLPRRVILIVLSLLLLVTIGYCIYLVMFTDLCLV